MSIDGPPRFTPRERDVLRLLARGMTNQEIADSLGLTRNAVRFHMKEIHSKANTRGDRNRLTGIVRRAWLSVAGADPAKPSISLGA